MGFGGLGCGVWVFEGVGFSSIRAAQAGAVP